MNQFALSVIRAGHSLVLPLALSAVFATAAVADPVVERARALLQATMLVDGHNDLPWAIRTDDDHPGDPVAYGLDVPTEGDTDIARLRAGGVGAQFWSVYTPGEAPGGFARTQLEQIDIARRMIAAYPDDLQFAGNVADIRAAKRAGKIASLLGIEGGHAIENSLGALRAYYDLGVRYMTLTHNTHTDWADSAAQFPPRHGGLNEFGESVVLEMNRLGMLIDLSHTSDETQQDVLRLSRAPVIYSHSTARAVCDVPRNVSDETLKLLRHNGGVVMVTFVAGFVDPEVAAVMQPAIEAYNEGVKAAKTDAERSQVFAEIFGNLQIPTTTIGKVADHIEHVRDIAGIEHVGIGGDFDGNSYWPEGLSDVSMYPNLFAELIRRGWHDRELKMLAGENVLRAMSQAEAVAAVMQARVRSHGR